MNRNHIIYAVVGVLILFVVVWAINGREDFSWRQTFKIDDKDPYGLYMMYELLRKESGFKALEDSIAGQLAAEETANYCFVGQGMYMRPQDRDELLAFVERGNTAFIATNVLPFDLMFYLYYDECNYLPWDGFTSLADTTVRLNFLHPDLQQEEDYAFTHIVNHKAAQERWPIFPGEYICDYGSNKFEAVGTANDTSYNLVRVPYGGGYFYLHTQPLVFTNYYMIKDTARAYAQAVFSHLNDGPVYWDEYSRVPESVARRQNNEYRSNPGLRLESESPLRYVLDQPPLAWAWYTLVGIGALFLLFRTRRRQRVIPVLEAPRNTSARFVETIGWLYFQEANHQQVAKQAIRLLRTHVRERYGLSWRDNSEPFIDQLTARSGVNRELIAHLVKDAHNIPRYTGLLEGELVKFHQRLEQFYATSK